MLASLPIAYLLLLAAAATFVFCFAMTKWIPGRRGKIVFPLVSIGCCLGMILAGRLQSSHWGPQHMLVLYSFSWIGLTLGLFPSRKLMHTYATEINQGVKREKYPVPVRYQLAAIFSVIIMTFLAYGLS
ncbi:hypothetical protein IPZ58_26880 [Streptomyces roseoverticillatus]|uniref:hypothetical protein n=1 Tax=Streptomyces roseoverticillatus TaxID=66429 RepID=UPI001F1D4C86|nr:hypothetical protein [Streptomyces roseoverticillatus]MCF3105189.1 hypothetical protein [Streptomyces roseoverticillatus]